MTSRREQLRNTATRITESQQEGNPAAAVSSAVRTSPVRVTLDLSPAMHGELVRWCADAAARLGKPRVGNQAVIRALIDRVTSDEDLSEQVRRDLSGH